MGHVGIKGTYTFTILRADGSVETLGPLENLVPDPGSVQMAKLILGESTSKPFYMAVGSGTTAVAMAQSQLIGEMGRKALATNATSVNKLIQVATWGGAADSLTSLTLNEVGVFNHANSGYGEMTSRLMYSSSAVTLAGSDLLKIEIATTVGSHT